MLLKPKKADVCYNILHYFVAQFLRKNDKRSLGKDYHGF